MGKRRSAQVDWIFENKAGTILRLWTFSTPERYRPPTWTGLWRDLRCPPADFNRALPKRSTALPRARRLGRAFAKRRGACRRGAKVYRRFTE
jgi:hypothetical protein